MELDAVLAPWLARADALYADWRNVLHGGRGDALEAGRRPAFALLTTRDVRSRMYDNIFGRKKACLDDAQQPEFRELMEILALAWHLDASKCVALACEEPREKTLLRAEPARPQELLRLAVAATTKPGENVELLRGFFENWTEATASDAFKETKQKLLQLYGRSTRGQRFELSLQLSRWGGRLQHVLRLLERIDRSVFRVTRITVTIQNVHDRVEDLTELFRLLHGFRDEADVCIRLQMGQDRQETVHLDAWKPVFDLIARTQFAAPASCCEKKNNWDLVVSCGGVGFEDDVDRPSDRWSVVTHARVVAACFSALAHAADHVTSIHLIHPLEDKTSDYRPPVGRRERARWLGYLLRTSAVDRITVDETELTEYDLREILEILEAPTREKCLRRLWESEWSRAFEDLYGPSGTKVVGIQDGEKYLSDPNQVCGVMNRAGYQDTSSTRNGTENTYADVFLVGYGQCSVHSSHLALVDSMNKSVQRVPERKAQLKALTFCVSGNRHSLLSSMAVKETIDRVILRLLARVGAHLEELTVQATNSSLGVGMIAGILRTCPILRRLDIQQLDLNASDDGSVTPTALELRHPLEYLTVQLETGTEPLEMEALCECLMAFGVELRGFRVGGSNSSGEFDESSQAPMDKLLRSCFQSCSSIEVSRLPIEFFQEIFKPDAVGFSKLETLIAKDVFWAEETFTNLVSALSTPTHSLARSLRTLAIRITRFNEYGDTLIAEMLEGNRSLVNFRFDTLGLFQTRMGDSNGVQLQRLKTALSKRQKAAFVSVVESTPLPWESFVIAKIFRFVIEPELRQVVVTIYP